MLERGRFKRGECGYGSIPFSEHNNHDVYRFWNNKIKQDELAGKIPSQWEGWLRTWGQFARVCVAYKIIRVEDLVKEGRLYRLLENRDLIEIFIRYYSIRGSEGTVACKAIQLNRLGASAVTYFEAREPRIIASNIKENMEVSLYFGTVS